MSASQLQETKQLNTERWNSNSIVLTQSLFSKLHRRMVLKQTGFHRLVTDKSKQILDDGCGTGPFLIYFASKGYNNLYGIEPDVELTKDIPSNIAHITNCRAENLPFNDNTFDIVFIYGVLHHLKGLDSFKKACHEAYRVLRPNGLIFIIEPGKYVVFRIVEIVAKLLSYVSSTFRAFSECLEDERPDLYPFLKNHDFIRDYLSRISTRVLVNKYFTYVWIFTAQK